MNSRQFRLAYLSYDAQSNILTFKVNQDQVIDVAEMNEMIGYVQELVGEKEHYAIVDFGSSLLSTQEARKAYADSEFIQKYRLADGFVVRSLAVRLVANFFITVTKPKVRTKLFTDEQQAMAWLEKQKAVINLL